MELRTFEMYADSAPQNFECWIPDFPGNGRFQAENLDAAREYLDNLCRQAGTDSDPDWGDCGPNAREAEDSIKEVLMDIFGPDDGPVYLHYEGVEEPATRFDSLSDCLDDVAVAAYDGGYTPEEMEKITYIMDEPEHLAEREACA